jgi:uncharacterized protein YyaL (SSP411 family)
MRCWSTLPASAGTVARLALALLAVGPAALAEPNPKRPSNRLAKETSPYLLLHAHNPVDWYPWGPEAFAKAKAEKKPIFLSIGYSSCYWCHVMERECFMDPQIARMLNENYVSIKVDREERPDIDQIYMAALQAFGNGGWPMSMFLTPDGRPFYGGTYFPPRDRDGMRGFPTVLAGVSEAWHKERPQLEEAADRLSEIVRRSVGAPEGRRHVPLSRDLIAQGRAQLAEQFDPEYGGFGFNPENARRPKFPEPVNLVFLLDQHRRDTRAKRPADARTDPLAMVLKTLDHMARGGIRDQLAGGYHRYATSRYWIVPHFEKMLYDNAQLASAHLLAFELTRDDRWRREAEATFGFIERSMSAPDGGFYSAIDAETDGDEGQYYVWTRAQAKAVLGEGEDYEAFAQVYGLKREPNFENGRYVLLEPRSRGDQAVTLRTTPEALEVRLAPLRGKLLAARERRPAPLRDDKVLTSWNGLMIAAYADAARILKEPRYRRRAEQAADFLLSKLRGGDGRLLRTFRAGQAKLPAYLEDYAFLAHGLLRLHAATGDPARLAQARALTDRMIADFEDAREGGFFYTANDHESLLARPKDPYDGALPSGNGVAILNLLDLASATKEPRYLDLAGKALESFSPTLAQTPGSLPTMLLALGQYLDARPAAGSEPAHPAPPPQAAAQGVVSARAERSGSEPIGPGRTFDVVVSVAIKEGWHLYANPTGLANLKPTTLVLRAGQPAELVGVEYPAGTPKVLDANAGQRVPLYEGAVRLKVRLRLDQAATSPPETLKLELRYQACDDRLCLAPAALEVPVALAAGR